MDSHLKGSLLILLSLVVFSLQSTLSRVYGIGVLGLISLFGFLGVVCLGAYFLVSGRRNEFRVQHPPLLLLLAGALICGTLVTFYSAIRLTTLANTVLLHYTAPLFAILLAVLVLRERAEWQSFAAAGLSLVGVFLVFGRSLHLAPGLGLALLSGVLYGGVIVLNKKLADSGSILSLIFYTNLLLGLFLLPFLLRDLPSSPDFWLMALMSPLNTTLGPLLYLCGLRAIQAQHASIISYAEILFTIFLGWLFFGELPAGNVLLGGLLIILSGAWAVRRETRPQSI